MTWIQNKMFSSQIQNKFRFDSLKLDQILTMKTEEIKISEMTKWQSRYSAEYLVNENILLGF
jgi:hypothetical protein